MGAIIGPDNHKQNGLSPSSYICAVPNDFRFQEIIIENNIWVGAYAIITDKCNKIGTGAIIAAGAVVTEPVPPYAVVAGVPARIIKYRFPPDKIKQLLDSQWWNLPYDKLKNMNCENVDIFLSQLKTACKPHS